MESIKSFMQIWQGAGNVAILLLCAEENNHYFGCFKSYRTKHVFFGSINFFFTQIIVATHCLSWQSCVDVMWSG